MPKKMFLIAGSLLTLVACKPLPVQNIPADEVDSMAHSSEAMMEDDSMAADDSMMKEDDAMMKKEDDKMMEDDSMAADDSMMKEDDKMMDNDKKDMEVSAGQYLAYQDGVIGNGKSSVLFFKAAWCPSCKKNDGILSALYEKDGASLNTYKIDYDTATELKKQFGITSQDTFVLIDGSGKAVSSVTFPSESALLALVQ